VILGCFCFKLELCIVLLTPVSCEMGLGHVPRSEKKQQVEETAVLLDLVQGCAMVVGFFSGAK
jgi:hypothetical protein